MRGLLPIAARERSERWRGIGEPSADVPSVVANRTNDPRRISSDKGIRGNVRLLEEVRHHAEKAWRYGLSRRSGTRSVGWEKFEKLLQTYVLPTPRIVHTI